MMRDAPTVTRSERAAGSDELTRYFSRYPGRDRRGVSLLFRRGERERFELLRRWTPDCAGLAILDAGCGDGAFLQRLLQGRPACIRVEDVVEAWTQMAGQRLAGAADRVTAVCTDIRASTDDGIYDIVFALGVFDYEADWLRLLQILVRRSRGVVVADFPKRGTLHSWLRRLWLAVNGLRLHATDRHSLENLLRLPGVSYDIEELHLQWVVRIRVASAAQQ